MVPSIDSSGDSPSPDDPWRPAPGPLQPVIKWPGSKRSLAVWLRVLFPASARRYLEPFVGGGAMLPLRPAGPAVAGDTVSELVEIWARLRDRPQGVAAAYRERWERLRRDGAPAFYAIRRSFNLTRDPDDLLFLCRTSVNGLARFNASGDFNNSLHLTRPGVSPGRLERVIARWHGFLRGVSFRAADYRESLADAGAGDFVFLDPPYGGTRGRYRPGPFDLAGLFTELERLNRVGARWLLTLDGSAGPRSYASAVPPGLARTSVSLPSGHSPFTRLMRTGLDPVIETVYLNYEPPPAALALLPAGYPRLGPGDTRPH